MDVVKQKLENNYNIKIIYLCEFGSRIQGHSCKSSDYDVKGIFQHSSNDTYMYSNIFGNFTSDIITKIENKYDIQLWDITKVLKLFYQSRNQTPILWLRSTTVYYKNEYKSETLKNFLNNHNSYNFAFKHCFGKFNSHLKDFINKKDDDKNVKHLAIAIYKIFAIEYILQNQNPNYPLHFTNLQSELMNFKELTDQSNSLRADWKGLINLYNDVVDFRNNYNDNKEKLKFYVEQANYLNSTFYPHYWNIYEKIKKEIQIDKQNYKNYCNVFNIILENVREQN